MNPISWLSRRPTSPRRRGDALPIRLERLEDRVQPAALLGPALGVRSIDGTGNNLLHPTWGRAGTDLLRTAPAAYADGVSTPAGSDRPSARVVSNAVADQGTEDIISDRLMSAMVYAWGQFVDHDLDLTLTGTPSQPFNVPVPAGDPYFDPSGTGTAVIPLSRSAFDAATGTGVGNPRQQVNSVTAWVDGSQVYGSDAATAASLRTFQGGRLKTSDGNLLPTDAAGNFLAGDIRVNENPELTSLHTLFVREHNRIADGIRRANPGLNDEAIYQRARAEVIAELQVITYREWLPALLGPNALRPYQGYNPAVNPGIANEFSTAAFRIGHSLLGDDIEFLGNDGLPVADEVSLAEAFFNPDLVTTNGIASILKYLSSDPSSELDSTIVDSVRNFLFGPPGAGGLDLASLNIQRGRDHGLADYNTIRAAYHLPRVTSFAQITANGELQQKLQQLYDNVNNIDAWVGMLAEDHVGGGSTGPLVRAVLSDQFSRLRDGDRFWYQRAFSGPQLRQLENTTLADVIRRNTTLTNLQPNVFYFRVTIGGTVYNDANHSGRQDRGEPGLSNVAVQLIDVADGSVVATTRTDARGNYEFGVDDGLGVGRYRVRQMVPQGWVPTNPPPPAFGVTRGDTHLRVDFGDFRPAPHDTPVSMPGAGQQPGGAMPPPPPQPGGRPPAAPQTTTQPPPLGGQQSSPPAARPPADPGADVGGGWDFVPHGADVGWFGFAQPDHDLLG